MNGTVCAACGREMPVHDGRVIVHALRLGGLCAGSDGKVTA